MTHASNTTPNLCASAAAATPAEASEPSRVTTRPRIVFISWAPYCSRSDSMAARLAGRSHMVYSGFWGSHYATIAPKYLFQTCRTLAILLRERPRFVFVMAPPVVACLPVWLYGRLTGTRYVIDAHTGAFLDRRWKGLPFLQRFFSRRAVTTIVTNSHLAGIVEKWGADATIVPDVPICFPEPETVELGGNCKMTLVASFCPDEPIGLFLEAAARVPDISFYVTGDGRNLDRALRQKTPPNVSFTGFLPDARYVGQLRASDAVLALTTRDHTMQRAAYEAIYLGKPVVTSGFPILREAFPKGAVHVDLTVEGIARGLQDMQSNLARYEAEARQLRTDKLRRWDEAARQLLGKLDCGH